MPSANFGVKIHSLDSRSSNGSHNASIGPLLWLLINPTEAETNLLALGRAKMAFTRVSISTEMAGVLHCRRYEWMRNHSGTLGGSQSCRQATRRMDRYQK